MHRLHDDIPLPKDGEPVMAHAERRDHYPVHVTTTFAGLLDRLCPMLDDAGVVVLTDQNVEALYGPTLVRGLRERGVDPLVRAIPPGERSKSLEQAVALWHWLAESDTARRDVLVAFGGGVIADLGGWVASCYMRGLPYVNVPTTLLAQVDGALGGKVAVNHALAKNLIGGFQQPRGVVSDVSLLRSISGRHLRAGLAEAIKKAVIASPAYWAFIEEQAEAILERERTALERLVRAAAAIKTGLIARDPYEHDLRRPLNFGHTIGHPLETVTGYGPLLHGEAVAFGMVVEARIAVGRGLLAPAVLERLEALLQRCGLPTSAAALAAPVEGEAILRSMGHVRLIRAGSLRYVLPTAPGRTVIADDVEEEEVRQVLRDCGVPFQAPVLQ